MGEDYLAIKNREVLKKTYDENKKNVAVFVGAGGSNILGINMWDEVLENMRKKFQPDINEIDFKEKIKCLGYAKTASEIYHSTSHSEYISFMREEFRHKRAYHYSIHIKILSIFNVIVTTNYDNTFEEALNDLEYYLKRCRCNNPLKWEINKLEKFNHDMHEKSRPPHLVYLHCNLENDEFIFIEEEYKKHYPTYFEEDGPSKLESFLEYLLGTFSIIFIGFSFNDDIFTKFYKDTINNLIIKKEENIASEKNYEEIPPSFVFYKLKYPLEEDPDMKRLKDDLKLKVITIDNYLEIEKELHKLRDIPEVKKDWGDAAFAK
ncbi:SIR2 family protein [uncultured Methanobacterium sp.]|uniref:SIR2 family protein n=1 Tax=uncultured Methanobacterium sp. TaxID=176306 RepID=UPI002AA6531F|nr:SIR2 family protein [uncultured Methanobacterium sp.]